MGERQGRFGRCGEEKNLGPDKDFLSVIKCLYPGTEQ
jgi:hypothetical protein